MIYHFIVTILITAIFSILLTFSLIKLLYRLNITNIDIFKTNKPKIPTNIGISYVISLILVSFLFYKLSFVPICIFISIGGVILIATVVGLIDDCVKLPGYYKPLAMLIGGIPLILTKCYIPYLKIAFFGGFKIPLLYPFFILIAISITANMVNMLDVINGSAVWGVFISIMAGIISGIILRSQNAIFIGIMMLSSLAGLIIYNTYPAKGFIGNCGSLALGSSIGLMAILGRIEVPMIIATLPFIHNSFYFLAYTRKFIEHKELSKNITYLDERGYICDARQSDAPITLLRLLVSYEPITEGKALMYIIFLFTITAILSIITAFLISIRV